MFAYAKQKQKKETTDTVQKKASEKSMAAPNQTGIPDTMKTRFENLSGFSFDDVRVHYNSEKPAQLQAFAYTQGSQVYVAPGQEQHLTHELGHVVQQKQGIVQPTKTVNGISINDNSELEEEASDFYDGRVSTTNVPPAVQRQIIQKADLFVPNHTEPHLHFHSGGITYTSVGHRHKNLRAGSEDRISAVIDVMNELKDSGHPNAPLILQRLKTEFKVPDEPQDMEKKRLESIKGMLSEIGVDHSSLESNSDDKAVDAAISVFVPEPYSRRKASEYVTAAPYIPNTLLRNALYIERVYEDYFNYRSKQDDVDQTELEHIDGTMSGKNLSVYH